jgi:hypothetical protein
VDGEVHGATAELVEAEMGRRMARLAHPCGGAWRLMGNRRWKEGLVVEVAGGWVAKLRGGVLELGDGSERSERGWSGLSVVAQ